MAMIFAWWQVALYLSGTVAWAYWSDRAKRP
jgi:hypothetical protein